MELPKKNQGPDKGKGNIYDLEGAKIPPHSLETERSVLGAMIIDKRGVTEIIDMLSPEIFYDPKHQLIFKAVFTLFEEGSPVDLLTVTKRLEKTGELNEAGGPQYLIEITRPVATSANIEYHARLLLEYYVRREVISIGQMMQVNGYEDTKDIFNILDEAEQALYNISQGSLKQSAKPLDDVLMQVRNNLDEIAKNDKLPGVPSGYPSLDEITSGWQPGDLIILAARPSMGKTAFALNMARNIAIDHQKPVAFFSLEMNAEQLIKRILSRETMISADKFRTGKFTDHEQRILEEKFKLLAANGKLYINDSSMLSIFDLRAQARRLKQKHGIEIIFIDYLQLMHASDRMKPGNREQEISTISRNLKSLAKELNIPIIALSQLSRKVEDRAKLETAHKRPMLSDLRESGAIEQDADIVAFIYRPEYYRITEWDDDENTPAEGEVELNIAKHRNGRTGAIYFKFQKEFGLITERDAVYSFVNDPAVLPSKINNMTPDPKDSFDLDHPQNDDDDFPF